MRVVDILSEAPAATAVMAFGRMNPPTIGHAKLVDKLSSLPGDPYIFLSQSQKPKTDPLSFQDKLRYAKFFFPNVTIGNPQVKTIIQALQKLNELGYDNLIYVAGSDRVPAFEEMINKYNGKEYNFNSIKVVSAGERDPDADGAEGMSASKMRAAAAAGDLESFKQGVPQPEVADEMFAAVRQGMGVKDAVPAEGVTESDLSPEDEDEFHRMLDKLVHKYFGHSSDEKKMKERSLTSDEKSNREKNIKKLKKHKGEFEKRYGKDALSVMYAIATKRAKGKSIEETESYLDIIKRTFDFSGGDDFQKKYVPFARKWLQIYKSPQVYAKMLKAFPDAKPVDLKRAISFAQRGNYQ